MRGGQRDGSYVVSVQLVQDWDIVLPGALWDNGLSWDVNSGPNPGTVDRYIALVPPENQNKPNFIAFLSMLLQPLCDAQAVLATIPSLFDVDNAVGVQLDVVGKWVGATRNLQVAVSGSYFSFDISGLGWDQAPWYAGQPTTALTTLDDAHYRLLIKARIANNKWDGTIPGAYAIWDALFAGTGVGILIQDYGNMTIALALTGTAPDAVTFGLFISGDLNTKPAGVELEGYMTPFSSGVPYFGFDVENSVISGYDVGAFGNVYPGA